MRSFKFNRDVHRRDDIMGTTKVSYYGGLKDFAKATVEQLRLLLEEGFIDPESRQNDSPRVCEFYEFLKKWPQATVGGHLVHPDRSDYRVSIDLIECDLSKIPAYALDTFRDDFTKFSSRADEYQNAIGFDSVRAWWD